MSGRCTVFLTEQELEVATRIADVRNAKNGKVPNFRVTRATSDWSIHFAGVRAEIACCKFFGFPLDQHETWDGDSGAPDLYYADHRLEVKAATHWPPILKLNTLPDFKSDVIILCYTPTEAKEIGNIFMAGAVSRQKFCRDHYVRNFSYGERVCMNHEDMVTVDNFKKLAKKKEF